MVEGSVSADYYYGEGEECVKVGRDFTFNEPILDCVSNDFSIVSNSILTHSGRRRDEQLNNLENMDFDSMFVKLTTIKDKYDYYFQQTGDRYKARSEMNSDNSVDRLLFSTPLFSPGILATSSVFEVSISGFSVHDDLRLNISVSVRDKKGALNQLFLEYIQKSIGENHANITNGVIWLEGIPCNAVLINEYIKAYYFYYLQALKFKIYDYEINKRGEKVAKTLPLEVNKINNSDIGNLLLSYIKKDFPSLDLKYSSYVGITFTKDEYILLDINKDGLTINFHGLSFQSSEFWYSKLATYVNKINSTASHRVKIKKIMNSTRNNLYNLLSDYDLGPNVIEEKIQSLKEISDAYKEMQNAGEDIDSHIFVKFFDYLINNVEDFRGFSSHGFSWEGVNRVSFDFIKKLFVSHFSTLAAMYSKKGLKDEEIEKEVQFIVELLSEIDENRSGDEKILDSFISGFYNSTVLHIFQSTSLERNHMNTQTFLSINKALLKLLPEKYDDFQNYFGIDLKKKFFKNMYENRDVSSISHAVIYGQDVEVLINDYMSEYRTFLDDKTCDFREKLLWNIAFCHTMYDVQYKLSKGDYEEIDFSDFEKFENRKVTPSYIRLLDVERGTGEYVPYYNGHYQIMFDEMLDLIDNPDSMDLKELKKEEIASFFVTESFVYFKDKLKSLIKKYETLDKVINVFHLSEYYSYLSEEDKLLLENFEIIASLDRQIAIDIELSLDDENIDFEYYQQIQTLESLRNDEEYIHVRSSIQVLIKSLVEKYKEKVKYNGDMGNLDLIMEKVSNFLSQEEINEHKEDVIVLNIRYYLELDLENVRKSKDLEYFSKYENISPEQKKNYKLLGKILKTKFHEDKKTIAINDDIENIEAMKAWYKRFEDMNEELVTNIISELDVVSKKGDITQIVLLKCDELSEIGDWSFQEEKVKKLIDSFYECITAVKNYNISKLDAVRLLKVKEHLFCGIFVSDIDNNKLKMIFDFYYRVIEDEKEKEVVKYMRKMIDSMLLFQGKNLKFVHVYIGIADKILGKYEMFFGILKRMMGQYFFETVDILEKKGNINYDQMRELIERARKTKHFSNALQYGLKEDNKVSMMYEFF